MANGMNGAIDRRLRGLLPREDFAAAGVPGAAFSAGPFISPGEPGFVEPGVPTPGTGPFADLPPDPMTQQILAQAEGQAAGMDAVARRQAALAAAGGGQFLDPSTGGSAQLGGGRFRTSPAMFMAGGGLGIDERIREIGEAVKRRLEELTGAPPNQPQFASPGSAILRRGRFGT